MVFAQRGTQSSRQVKGKSKLTQECEKGCKMSLPTAATPVGPCNEQYQLCATAGPTPVNIAEYEKHAMSKLPKNAFDYYASGANDMITLRENRAAFSRLRLMPKILVDVSSLNTETTVLGDKVSSPICIAPSAMQKMAHPDGNVFILMFFCLIYGALPLRFLDALLTIFITVDLRVT